MGVCLGVILSLGVFFEFTKNLDPQYSWGITSILTICFSIICLFMIDEPPEGIPKRPIFKSIKSLSIKQYKALKRDKKLMVGMILIIFIRGPQVLQEIYIMSWLRSFNGGNDQVYSLYQYQGIAGCIGAFFILSFVGTLADKFSPKIVVPAMLLLRSFFYFLTFTIVDPTRFPFYFIVPMIHVSFYAVYTTFDAYLTQMYPDDLKGMMSSC